MAGIHSVEIADDQIAVIVIETNNWAAFGDPRTRPHYFEVKRRSWQVDEITTESFSAKHPKSGASTAKLQNPYKWGKKWPLQASDETQFKTEKTECEAQEEGDPICKNLFLSFGGAKHRLPVDDTCTFGCDISAIEKWNDQIWTGLFSNGEIQPYGYGLHVFNSKSLKRVHRMMQLKPGEYHPIENPVMLPTLIRRDPKDDRIWIGSNLGLHSFDKTFQLLSECKVSVSTKTRKTLYDLLRNEALAIA